MFLNNYTILNVKNLQVHYYHILSLSFYYQLNLSFLSIYLPTTYVAAIDFKI